MQASQIAVLDAAVGPVTYIDVANGRLAVMGQNAVALERGDLLGMKAGDWVRVSGQRLTNGEIRASRVQAIETDRVGVAVVTGPVTQVSAGAISIGATSVRLTNNIERFQLGQEVSVRGSWTGQALQSSQVTVQPTRAAMGAVSGVLLQGYVHAVRAGELQLGYQTLQLGEHVQVRGGQFDQLKTDQPIQVRAHFDAQRRLTVDRIDFRSEGRRGRSSDDNKARSDDSKDGTEGRKHGDDGSESSGKDGSSGSDSSGSSGSGKSSSSGGSSGSGGEGGGGRGRK